MAEHEKLRSWQVSYELAGEVYRVTRKWPRDELYGLTSQARRAAFSVPANIAEGNSRWGRGELRRFLDIARSSLAELQVILRFARDQRFLSGGDYDRSEQMRQYAARLVWRQYTSLGPR